MFRLRCKPKGQPAYTTMTMWPTRRMANAVVKRLAKRGTKATVVPVKPVDSGYRLFLFRCR